MTTTGQLKKRRRRPLGRGLAVPIVDELNARVGELRREGRDVISLAQATPGFPVPPALTAGAFAALHDTGVHSYTADAGIPELRRGIARWLGDIGDGQVDAEDGLIVTAGANQAFMLAALTVFEPGDHVLLASPYFFNHDMALRAGGVEPVEVACDGGACAVDVLLARVTPKVRGVVITTPSNPTGAVLSPVELLTLATALKDAGLWLIVDETYLPLVYETRPASGTQWLHLGNVVVVGSFSKTFAMMGWRIGYLAAPADVTAEALKVQDAMLICNSAIAQHTLLAVLRDAPTYYETMLPVLRERRDYLMSRLAPVDGIDWVHPDGGLFLFARVRQCADSYALSRRLLDDGHVATVPGRAFGAAGEGYLRISYGAVDVASLERACDRIVPILQGTSR